MHFFKREELLSKPIFARYNIQNIKKNNALSGSLDCECLLQFSCFSRLIGITHFMTAPTSLCANASPKQVSMRPELSVPHERLFLKNTSQCVFLLHLNGKPLSPAGAVFQET